MTYSATDRPPQARGQTARRVVSSETGGRVDAAFRRAQRHSRRVRVLKFALPAVAVLAIAAFVGVSWLSAPTGVSVGIGATAIENGRLVMSDPKLDGFTSDNRAYSMSAARAVQDLGNAARIDLEGIDARLPFDEANWITVAARSGMLDRSANTLALNSEVTVATDTGIKAVLQSATVDIAAGNLDTDDPVAITLDGARIEADSLQVRERGAVMIFENRVRMQIEGGRLTTASTSEGGANEN